MTASTLKARWRLFRTASRTFLQRRRARVLRTPLAGLLLRPQRCDEIILVPSDLRTPDPHFANEFDCGLMVLAGHIVELGGASPFAITRANQDWLRELHGFGWLNHLTAAGDRGQALAAELVLDWIARPAPADSEAHELAVAARRVISWLSHSGLILEGAEPSRFTTFMRSLASQLRELDIRRYEAPPGTATLLATIATLLADLSIAGRENDIAETERRFLSELDTQVLSDGGHVSRNPRVILELLLDLLPLRRCYLARERNPPGALVTKIDQMVGFLRAMRLGDGSLGCFNGMGPTPVDALATVLSVDSRRAISTLEASRYARIAAGDLVLLMDCGPAPPAEYSSSAQAGCLSIEVSDGGSALLVNCGFPASAPLDEIAAARSTAGHSTLTLGGTSSARLVTHRNLGLTAARAALSGPSGVQFRTVTSADGSTITGSHDGYVAAYQLVHTRTVTVAADGTSIAGEDRLAGRPAPVRLRRDAPFAIRFHLAPDCRARLLSALPAEVEIELSGRVWRLAADGIEGSLEPTFIHGRGSGGRHSQQIVLRATTAGDTTVTWRLTRL